MDDDKRYSLLWGLRNGGAGRSGSPEPEPDEGIITLHYDEQLEESLERSDRSGNPRGYEHLTEEEFQRRFADEYGGEGDQEDVESEPTVLRALPPRPSPERAFQLLALLTPRRIWNEDVGDAIETICAMERSGCSRMKIKAKVISTYFWVLVAIIRELVAAVTGRKSPHR